MWLSITLVLIIVTVTLVYQVDIKRGIDNNFQNTNTTMNTSNIKIVGDKLTDKQWKMGSTHTIAWSVDNVPEGQYVTEIDFVDVSTKLSVGSIPHGVNETKNGMYKTEYKVSTILLGGDAIQPLNPGRYQLLFKILKLEADNGTSQDPYRPKYSPEYFYEVVAESYGDIVDVTS